MRRFAAVVSVATLVAWSILPPVHIHVGEGSDSRDRTEGIIHAHWSAHEDEAVDVSITLRDGHGHRLVLDQQATVSPPHDSGPILAIGVVTPSADTALPCRRAFRRGADAATRDGPCRGLSLLRAPPVVA
jgi:hypothetical protein